MRPRRTELIRNATANPLHPTCHHHNFTGKLIHNFIIKDSRLFVNNKTRRRCEIRIPKDEGDLQFTMYKVQFVKHGGCAARGAKLSHVYRPRLERGTQAD